MKVRAAVFVIAARVPADTKMPTITAAIAAKVNDKTRADEFGRSLHGRPRLPVSD
jgi:hypothetical protein